jgi:hypothetical protein
MLAWLKSWRKQPEPVAPPVASAIGNIINLPIAVTYRKGQVVCVGKNVTAGITVSHLQLMKIYNGGQGDAFLTLMVKQ